MLAQMRELAPARDRYARAQARGGTARPLALPIAEREEPRVLPQVQIQTNLRYSLSVIGALLESVRSRSRKTTFADSALRCT